MTTTSQKNRPRPGSARAGPRAPNGRASSSPASSPSCCWPCSSPSWRAPAAVATTARPRATRRRRPPAGSPGRADDGTVTVSGDALVPLPDAGADPAIGQPMPTLSGTGLDGTPVSFPTPGRATMIMFVAHWCPHCQAEVPVVQQWVDDGGLPADVDLVTVSTAADERRPNFPPADWLAGEGWTAPVLADDAGQTAAEAAGLTAFPFFVAVDANGDVVVRASGELAPAQLDSIAAEISGAAS